MVEPAWRRRGVGAGSARGRRGVGAELTRRRLARVHADGEAAWCFTNARNTASIALHAALGFVEVGRAPSYLGESFTGGVGVLRADAGGGTA